MAKTIGRYRIFAGNAFLIIVFLFLFRCSNIIYTSSGFLRVHLLTKDLLDPINEVRAKGVMCGYKYHESVRPVVWNAKIGQASLEHSLDMAKNGFLSHKGSDGSDPGERLLRAGYVWNSYGENIGQGYKTPEEAVRAWLKNEFHCKNIMNPEYKEAGASYARSENLRTYWTIVFGNPRR